MCGQMGSGGQAGGHAGAWRAEVAQPAHRRQAPRPQKRVSTLQNGFRGALSIVLSMENRVQAQCWGRGLEGAGPDQCGAQS